jgi:hypothetical protein
VVHDGRSFGAAEEKTMKKTVVASFAAAVLLVWGSLATAAPAVTGGGTAASKKYQATVYVAGHGGHFSKADVTIDPSDAANPLKVNGLDQVVIGDPGNIVLHDGRIDGNTLYWSTIALDKQGKLHVGKTDLKTGKVTRDIAFAPDPRSPAKAPPAYCASGQTKTTFMPVFMGADAYVDVFAKKDLKHLHRAFVSDLGYKADSYMFVHGTNSNDMKRFLLTLTLKGEDGKMNGKQDLLLLDLPALEKGKFKQLAKVTLTGEPGKTIAFRQYFSKDDKLIFQAAADRMWVLDAKTLKIVDEKMTTGFGENHDVQPTPDARYAILTVRNADQVACDADGKPTADKKVTDGRLVLYDAAAKKLVGQAASVCFDCHKSAGKGDKNAVLCGLASTFK